MTFNYHHNRPEERKQLIEFDKFLSELSDQYPEEFQKPIYGRMTFLGLGYNGTPYFHESVPEDIRTVITEKLNRLFDDNNISDTPIQKNSLLVEIGKAADRFVKNVSDSVNINVGYQLNDPSKI